MNRHEIESIVTRAIDRVIATERELLDRNVSERALTHHLARFIRDEIRAPFVVDVEYNRHLNDPKRMLLPPRTALDDELRAAEEIVHEVIWIE